MNWNLGTTVRKHSSTMPWGWNSWHNKLIILWLDQLNCVVLFCFKATCVRASVAPTLETACTFFFSITILFFFRPNTFKWATGGKSHFSFRSNGPKERMSWWSILTLKVKNVYFFMTGTLNSKASNSKVYILCLLCFHEYVLISCVNILLSYSLIHLLSIGNIIYIDLKCK